MPISLCWYQFPSPDGIEKGSLKVKDGSNILNLLKHIEDWLHEAQYCMDGRMLPSKSILL